jgi:hypothetical protein
MWVMASYYAAQALIVTGLLRSLQAQADRQKKTGASTQPI